MSRGARIIARTGAALCVLGLLLLAFVAYQLWGTSLYESQAQARLRQELSRELDHRSRGSAPQSTAPRSSGASAPSSTSGATTAAQRSPEPASTLAPTEADPPVGAPVGLLSIPAIGLSDVIVEGVGAPQLEQGPGHYPGTALPGEPGNVAIAGHRTTYARPFYNLNELQNGDPIYVLTPQGYFQYSVTGTQVVAPTDVGVLASQSESATLTLTTCNPRYSAATRLVVTAVFTPGPSPSAGPPERGPPPTATAAHRAAPPPTRGEPLGSNDESYWPGILWGLATLAVVVMTRLAWRRAPRPMRWGAVVVAVPLAAIGLLLCFEHLSLALPASF